MSRINTYPEADSLNRDDFLVIDGTTDGTRKIKPGGMVDPTLGKSGQAADARETGLRFGNIIEETHNIFPISEKRVDGASVQIDSNTVTVTSTKSNSGGCAVFFIDVRLLSNITLSFGKYTGTGSGGIRLANLDSTGAFVSWIKWLTDVSNTEDTTGKSFTEDVSQVNYLGIMLYAVRSTNTGIGKYITYEDVMVVSGTDARSYTLPLTAKDAVARKAIEDIVNPPVPVDTISPVNKSLSDTSLWEAGTINNSDGKNANQGNSIRLQKYIAVDPNAPLYFQAYYSLPTDRVDVSTTDNYNMRNSYILQYDKDGNYISRISISSDDTLKGSSITLNIDCRYIRIAFYTRLSNADISTIMPSVIYFDVIAGDYWLPPYYDGYLETKAGVIEQYAREAGGDGNVFVFITDEHAPQYSQMRSPAIIHKLAELTHLPILFSGGDVDQNGTKTDEFCDALRNAYNGEIHHLVGNHDFLNQNTGQSLYYDMDMYNSNQVGSGDHHYYYVDDPQRKTRYVCLAAYMESESAMGTGTGTAAQGGYTQEQIAWISNEALDVPSGWSIIVFTHYFYLINITSKVATLSYGSSILRTLSSNSNVIAVFQGHTHFDRIIKGHDEAAGSLPIIITSSDKNIEYGNEGWTVNRSKGTIYEQLFDVVIINKRTRTATMVRVGGLAEDGVNDNVGSTAEIRTVEF